MTTITDTLVAETVGPATLYGREWVVTPLMPYSLDTSADANTYRTRNANKARTVEVFLGVRYAESFAGANRWKEAIDYDYPAGEYPAYEWPNPPWQVYSNEEGTQGRPEWGVEFGPEDWITTYGKHESEDCGFLNIYRPKGTPPAGGWPVVVWFHGGGFVYRYCGSPRERGHRLCLEGVIVVNVGYRLSNFGHFYSPELAAEPGWNGPNFQYSDCVSALRWVNRNIGYFGGNPAKVVIGGSSAGAVTVLGLMEDLATQTLFSASLVLSGGGLGFREEEGPSYRSFGYAARYAPFNEAIVGMGNLLRDQNNLSRTIAAAIAADGYATAVRMGLRVADIQALSDSRERVTRATFYNHQGAGDPLTYSEVGSTNDYPYSGNGILHDTAVNAARSGAFDKPCIIAVMEHEASQAGDYAAWSNETASNYVRRLNYFSFEEWEKAAWVPGSWSAEEKRRQVYNHSVWFYPAWRIAKAITDVSGVRAYLCLWGFANSTSRHGTAVEFTFGNLEWHVGLYGGVTTPYEARVTERMLKMSVGWMQLVVNLAYNEDPAIAAPACAQSFKLYASPPALSLQQWSGANPERWNVVGDAGALTASGTAPVQIVNQDYLAGAWLDYFGKMG